MNGRSWKELGVLLEKLIAEPVFEVLDLLP